MPETIGDQLKRERLLRNLPIAQVAQDTHIRPHYIEAMEANNFIALPSSAQRSGFLRLYADYLGLDSARLLAILRGEIEEPAAGTESPPAAPHPAPKSTDTVTATTPKPGAVSDREWLTEEETAPSSQIAAKGSEVIFKDIGTQLRERRELLSLTLDEIERHTHVRKHYLIAFEEGAFERLPSPVQSRGMLASYASFLDLDAEAILLHFAEGLQAQRIERQPRSAKKPLMAQTMRPSVSWRQFVTVDLIFGGGLVLVLVLFAVWGAVRIIGLQNPRAEAVPTAPSISDILLASPSGPTAEVTAEPTQLSGLEKLQTSVPDAPVTETPTLQPIPNISTGAPVQMNVSITDRAWLRVVVDGKVAYEGRPSPGSAMPFEAEQQIEIITGNAAAIHLIYNLRDLGAMGAPGEVVDRVYTESEILNPTPTFTPTPTRTLRPSPTLRPTRTSASTAIGQ
jgi:cytoskeleton protein RodZ